MKKGEMQSAPINGYYVYIYRSMMRKYYFLEIYDSTKLLTYVRIPKKAAKAILLLGNFSRYNP